MVPRWTASYGNILSSLRNACDHIQIEDSQCIHGMLAKLKVMKPVLCIHHANKRRLELTQAVLV